MKRKKVLFSIIVVIVALGLAMPMATLVGASKIQLTLVSDSVTTFPENNWVSVALDCELLVQDLESTAP